MDEGNQTTTGANARSFIDELEPRPLQSRKFRPDIVDLKRKMVHTLPPLLDEF
jgi:hypothetical protein